MLIHTQSVHARCSVQGPQNRFVAVVEAVRVRLLCLWRREPYDPELSPYFAAQSSAIIRSALSTRRRTPATVADLPVSTEVMGRWDTSIVAAHGRPAGGFTCHRSIKNLPLQACSYDASLCADTTGVCSVYTYMYQQAQVG